MTKKGVAPSPHKKARIEIIPLIDIMFFLLASFMLVSMSMIKLQAIDTNVPPPNNGAPPPPNPDVIAISIDKAGQVYFAKERTPMPIPDLPRRLSPLYEQQKDDLKVYINADNEAPYGTVILVLDQVRAMGLTKVSFPIKKDNHFDPNAPTRFVPIKAESAPPPPAAP